MGEQIMENSYPRTRWYVNRVGDFVKAALAIVAGLVTMIKICTDMSRPTQDNKRENNRGRR